MPNLFNFLNLKIYFWSNEGAEPIHVHVSVKHPSPVSAKFWLLKDGSVKLANNKAEFSKKSLRRIEKFITINYDDIINAWKNYFEVSTVRFYQ